MGRIAESPLFTSPTGTEDEPLSLMELRSQGDPTRLKYAGCDDYGTSTTATPESGTRDGITLSPRSPTSSNETVSRCTQGIILALFCGCSATNKAICYMYAPILPVAQKHYAVAPTAFVTIYFVLCAPASVIGAWALGKPLMLSLCIVMHFQKVNAETLK